MIYPCHRNSQWSCLDCDSQRRNVFPRCNDPIPGSNRRTINARPRLALLVPPRYGHRLLPPLQKALLSTAVEPFGLRARAHLAAECPGCFLKLPQAAWS
jgi:hypothetical protein